MGRQARRRLTERPGRRGRVLAGRVSVTVVMIRMPDIIPATIHRRRRRYRIDAEQAIDAAKGSVTIEPVASCYFLRFSQGVLSNWAQRNSIGARSTI
jgi:hypothetical protein